MGKPRCTEDRERPCRPKPYVPIDSEIPTRGRSRGGRCANLSQIARQICAKLPVFGFANLKVNFGQFYANTPFPTRHLMIMSPSKFLIDLLQTAFGSSGLRPEIGQNGRKWLMASPKKPSRTKNSTESKFTQGGKTLRQ